MKEQLIQAIKEYLIHNPSDSPDLLQAITDGLKLYQQFSDKQRNHAAFTGMSNLAMMIFDIEDSSLQYLKNEHLYIHGFDAAFTLFPNGLTNNHLQYEKTFFTKFIEQCIAHDLVNDEWAGFNDEKHGDKFYQIIPGVNRREWLRTMIKKYQESKDSSTK